MVHRIDPILATVFGVHLWWYGLSYTLGLLNAHLYMARHRARLGLTRRQALDLSLLVAAGVLAGGRAVGVFHQWPLYAERPALIPAVWVGGFATHGLIAGGAAGVLAFCAWHGRPFRPILDALAVPAAVILGLGRLGNFIDGHIVGSVTEVAWAVKFPNADGFRHPVVLYDGFKNLAVAGVLAAWSRRALPPGRLAALFLILYAAPRIPIDLLREYPPSVFGLPGGQTFNVLMTVAGFALLARNRLRYRGGVPASDKAVEQESDSASGLLWRRALLAAILLGSLVIPSDAARDAPAAYGERHPGLVHTRLYPPL